MITVLSTSINLIIFVILFCLNHKSFKDNQILSARYLDLLQDCKYLNERFRNLEIGIDALTHLIAEVDRKCFKPIDLSAANCEVIISSNGVGGGEEELTRAVETSVAKPARTRKRRRKK